MENNFPTFQDSYFCDSGEQIVIRGNDFEQWKKDVAEAKNFFAPKLVVVGGNAHSKTATEVNATAGLPICDKVPTHGQMVVGRNGKPYCKKCYIEWKNSQGKTY